MSAVVTDTARNIIEEDGDDDEPNGLTTQDISGRNINQTKLTALLRMKFGVGAYDIHVSCSQVAEYCRLSKRICTDSHH